MRDSERKKTPPTKPRLTHQHSFDTVHLPRSFTHPINCLAVFLVRADNKENEVFRCVVAKFRKADLRIESILTKEKARSLIYFRQRLQQSLWKPANDIAKEIHQVDLNLVSVDVLLSFSHQTINTLRHVMITKCPLAHSNAFTTKHKDDSFIRLKVTTKELPLVRSTLLL